MVTLVSKCPSLLTDPTSIMYTCMHIAPSCPSYDMISSDCHFRKKMSHSSGFLSTPFPLARITINSTRFFFRPLATVHRKARAVLKITNSITTCRNFSLLCGAVRHLRSQLAESEIANGSKLSLWTTRSSEGCSHPVVTEQNFGN